MSFLQAIILGIIEGITEFLPVSSTGHLILATNALGLNQNNFVKTFEIAIQFGAILAVLFLYGRSLILNWQLIKKLLVAFLPTAAIGLIFYSTIKEVLLGSEMTVVVSLLIGGIFLILFERSYKEPLSGGNSMDQITGKQAFIIGLFQAIAIIPGVSRAAATIIGGLMLGINRRTIVEFSFLLAVPTMAAATGLDLIKSYQDILSGSVSILLTGLFVSFITAILGIKFLLRFINTHKFTAFGWYRIIVAIAFWFLIV